MSIDCQVKHLICDIDQFYIIKYVKLYGSKNGFNLGEIYNLQHITHLCAEGMIINSKIKLLRSLKGFDNIIYTNMIIGNLESLDALFSMNISFAYGHFSQDMILKDTTIDYKKRSHTFSGYYIVHYSI